MTTGTKARSRRGGGRPTIADVAFKAGVGAITVSRALREPDAFPAADIGLINEAVPAEALATRTAELASLIASGPTAAFRATKDILSQERSFDEVLELEARYQKEVTRGPDGQEGLAAFRERRSPVFKGK